MKSVNSIPSTTTTTTTVIANPTSSGTSNSHAPSNIGSIGYAPDAAWLAVRRHLQTSSFDDLLVSQMDLIRQKFLTKNSLDQR